MARKQKAKRIERGLYRAGKTYLACATPPGSRTVRWKTIGEVGLVEARSRRDAWVVEVRSGGVQARGGRETVKEVALAWLEYVERLVEIGELRGRTLESYKTGVMLHLIPDYGHRRIRSLTTDDLVEWHRKQRAAGASVWTIRARWMAVRGVLAYAARHGMIAASPAGKLLRRRRLAERYSTDSDFIFQSSTPRKPMTYKGLLNVFHRARDGAGLGDVTFHALRHTFASILIAQGRDVQFVSRQLGHTKTSTTWDTYVHLFDAQRHGKEARDQLETDYGGLLGGTSDGSADGAREAIQPPRPRQCRARARRAALHDCPVSRTRASAPTPAGRSPLPLDKRPSI